MERNIDRNGSSKPRAARILILTLPLAIVIRYGVATRYRPKGGLRTTTRDLMRQMETDLGTKLDWIAVDHHNTGHPHSHILLRGVTEDGKTLNIAGDYIAYGVRERASEIVTLELGRQSELEVTKQ